MGAPPPGALLVLVPFSSGGGGGAWALLTWPMVINPRKIKTNMIGLNIFFIVCDLITVILINKHLL
jgi:hypothetical protein